MRPNKPKKNAKGPSPRERRDVSGATLRAEQTLRVWFVLLAHGCFPFGEYHVVLRVPNAAALWASSRWHFAPNTVIKVYDPFGARTVSGRAVRRNRLGGRNNASRWRMRGWRFVDRKGIQSLIEKHHEISQLEEQNADKARQIEALRDRIQRLEQSGSEQELEIRKRTKAASPRRDIPSPASRSSQGFRRFRAVTATSVVGSGVGQWPGLGAWPES